MKNLIKVSIAVIVIAISGFKIAEYELKKNSAEVNQVSGYYLFIQSKPASEYEFLGKVNMPGMSWTGKNAEAIDIAIKRAGKQYPKSNALIFQDDELEKIDAILIK